MISTFLITLASLVLLAILIYYVMLIYKETKMLKLTRKDPSEQEEKQ